MESNTVTLKLERYHELLSFEVEQNEKRKHTLYIRNSSFGGVWREIDTDEDAVAKITEDLKESLDICSKLKTEIKELKEKKEPIIIKEKNFFKYMKLFFERSNKADA